MGVVPTHPSSTRTSTTEDKEAVNHPFRGNRNSINAGKILLGGQGGNNNDDDSFEKQQ
jgi:hypothetical protein